MTPTPTLLRLAVFCLLMGGAGWAGAQDPATATADAAVDSAEAALTDDQKIETLNARLVANPADGKAWNDLGVIYAGQGRFDLARDAFLSAVQSSPREADYHRNLGLALMRLDQSDLALREFEAYRRFDQLGGLDSWRLIGGAQAAVGQVDAARATYREGLEAVGKTGGAEALRLALALDKLESDAGNDAAVGKLREEFTPLAQAFLRDNAEGSDGWREAQSIVNNRVVMLVDEGKLLESSGLFAEAAVRYQAAYDLMPTRDDLLPRLVDVYLKAGDDLKAKVAARLARDGHPEKAGTWIATAKVYEKTDRMDDAIESYRKAFAIDPEFPDLRLAIGNLLMRQGRDREAAEFLKEGVTNADTKPEVVYNYAISQMREKNYHAAIASLRKVVAQRPDMTQAWTALGHCLRITEQYGKAVEPYTRSLEQLPDANIAQALGICAQKAEMYDTAISAYEQALNLDPTMVEARYNLSLSLMKAKRYADAVTSFEALRDLEGETYRMYYSLGLSYYYLGQYDQALDAFDGAAELKETKAVLNNIGLVYEAKGDKVTAAKWYKMAKESGN